MSLDDLYDWSQDETLVRDEPEDIPEHRISTVDLGTAWRSHCIDCGWKGEPRTEMDDAYFDAELHDIFTAMELRPELDLVRSEPRMEASVPASLRRHPLSYNERLVLWEGGLCLLAAGISLAASAPYWVMWLAMSVGFAVGNRLGVRQHHAVEKANRVFLAARSIGRERYGKGHCRVIPDDAA
jgi:hypothetical protein